MAGGPTNPYIPTLALAKEIEPGTLANGYYKFLTTGGTGLSAYTVPDTRIPNVLDLNEGAFQLSPYITYG